MGKRSPINLIITNKNIATTKRAIIIVIALVENSIFLSSPLAVIYTCPATIIMTTENTAVADMITFITLIKVGKLLHIF
jgi:hypothetical protein